MKSLRQLTDQLIGVRLDATNVSMWQEAATLRETARVAINDAILAFPTRIQMVYTSGTVVDGKVILPRRVKKIVRVTTATTTSDAGRELRHWTLAPTAQTAWLEMYDVTNTARIVVTYEYHQPALPADLTIASYTDSTGPATASGDLYDYWRDLAPAFVEISGYQTSTWKRVVGKFHPTAEGVAPLEFLEWVEGRKTNYAPQAGNTLSMCWVGDDDAERALMLQAQAAMYEFWITHRVKYEQYTAMASMQAFSLEDLQLLIRDLEARAAMARRRNRKLPPPSSAKLRRPIRR